MNEQRPTLLDIFSGIGGFSLAFEAEGFRTVAFVECDERKRIVLRYWWRGVPIFLDMRDIEGLRRFCAEIGGVDVLTGGVPCQPASALGQMRGTADERWLWPDTIRLVRAIRPRYAVFENPPSLLVLEGGRAWNGIVSGLAAGGYDLWWDVFPAAGFGAGHLRERLVLVAADAAGFGERIAANGDNAQPEGGETRDEFAGVGLQFSTNSHRAGLEGHAGDENGGAEIGGGYEESGRPVAPPDLRGRVFATAAGEPAWWHEAYTGVPVLAHGLPAKLVEATARCTGDAVVPQVVQPIARAIWKRLKAETKHELGKQEGRNSGVLTKE